MKTKATQAALLVFSVFLCLIFTTTVIFAEEIVNIPDPNLEAAIREVLNKPEGDITTADMEGITELRCFQKDIQDFMEDFSLYSRN